MNTFAGNGGIVRTDFGSTKDRAYSVLLQSDGKILVVGYSDNSSSTAYVPNSIRALSIARYNTDGSLDTSFDGDGKVVTATSSIGYDALPLPSGKILVSQFASGGFKLLRFNPDGSVDNTFSSNPVAGTPFMVGGSTLALQSDGKILMSFSNGITGLSGIARFTENGSLDTNFDGDGKIEVPTSEFNIFDIAIQRDGKILAAGSYGRGETLDFALLRFNANGSPDTSFDKDGAVTTDLSIYDYGYSLAIQSDGKIIIAGSTNIDGGKFALVRYNTDGSLDTSFDGDGKVVTSFNGAYDYGTSAAIQSDGKIIVAGYRGGGSYNSIAIARYNTDGSLDTSFDGDGKVVTEVRAAFGNSAKASVALQPDGKILVVGYSQLGLDEDFVLVRYNSNGSLDTSSTSTEVTSETHLLNVIVDKGVIATGAVLLKDLVETINFNNGVVSSHTVQYAGITFDYKQIDSLIQTVTRDNEFTSEFTKEINSYLNTEANITFKVAVGLVGVANIDSVILTVAGSDGNYVE